MAEPTKNEERQKSRDLGALRQLPDDRLHARDFIGRGHGLAAGPR